MIIATEKGIRNLIREFGKYLQERLDAEEKGYVVVDVQDAAREFIEQIGEPTAEGEDSGES